MQKYQYNQVKYIQGVPTSFRSGYNIFICIFSGGNGNRNGTCFTAIECQDKGGSSSGSCAAGFVLPKCISIRCIAYISFYFQRFGVCCVFTVEESGQPITQNCTYIRNPGFPSAYSGTSPVSYTINKCSSGMYSYHLCILNFITF